MLLVRMISAILIGTCCITAVAADDLAKQFSSPPPGMGCWTYWYWHVPPTKESITRDLEAMHAQGIEGVLTFPFERYMTPEWITRFPHLLDEAERLKLKIVVNNDTHWSCKVPWMTPELAEKKLVYSERVFKGNRRIAEKLSVPRTEGKFYREIVVLACGLDALPTADGSADAKQWKFKTANALWYSYAAGDLDVFYQKTREPNVRQVVQPETVLDISDRMSADGRLDWDAPAGRWLVLRFGYTILNKSCPDFFNREALDHHLRQSVEKLVPLAGKHVGTTWTHVHVDSYENGPQTWTPAFRDEFRKRRGYDMLRWLPVLAGRIVANPELSDRFLHDYRTAAARRLAREEGIFAGFSSGANLAAALQLLRGPCRGQTVAILICDSGLKYLSTDLWDRC